MVFMATQNPKKPETPVAPPSVGSDDAVVLERRTQRAKPPQMFQVVLLNDDFTPMEFVIEILIGIFGKTVEDALALTFEVHNTGKGIAGTYTRDIAETKVTEAMDLAKSEEHPLRVEVQPA